jgi:chromosome segregation ATPase
MYRHSKYDSVNSEEEIDKLKEEIKQLQQSNTDNINLLTEIDELKTKNLKHTKVIHAQNDKVDKYKELIENLGKEVNELKTQNGELKTKVAHSESSNVALAKKNDELFTEIKLIVKKANDQRDKIKIEYDKLVKAIEERDTHITLQKKQIEELKQLML